MGCGSILTSLDEVIVCVAAEEAVGEEGDDGVDCGHVQYSDAVKIELQHHPRRPRGARTFVVARQGSYNFCTGR